MDTKRIGNIGEAKVIAKFVEHGFPVYIPFGDNEKADIVVDINGKLCRIQVKTAVGCENGRIEFDLTSTTLRNKNTVRRKYSVHEVDYFALYSMVRDEVYLLKVEENVKSSICIRFEEAGNKQKTGVKYECDYMFEKVLGL